MKYTKRLNFEEDPNYNYMRWLFINLLTSKNYQNDLKFSWLSTKKKKGKEIQNNQRNHFLKRKGSPQGRILKQIQTSQEREKKMDNIKNEKIIDILEEKQEKRDNEIIEINEKEKMIESPNKNTNENVQCIQETPSFNKATRENSHNEGFHENKEDDATQIAQLNMPILVEDSDENTKNIENNNNINNINNDNKKINSIDNVNVKNNINIVLNNKNELEKKENNIFFLSNESFKGSENFENINQSNEKYNDKNNKNNQNLLQEKKEMNIKTDLNNSSNNIFSNKNNINPIINKTFTAVNMNKGKIINISRKYNKMMESIGNSSNEIKFQEKQNKYPFQNLLNSNFNIKNLKQGEKIKPKNININKININDNNISDINNLHKKNIPMRNLLFEDKNNETSKTKNSINTFDFKKGIDLKRNIINYNRMDAKMAKSEGKKILKIIPNNMVNNVSNKILINNNSAKDVRRIYWKNNDNSISRNMIINSLNVSPKKNFTLNINSNPNSHRNKKKKLLKNISYNGSKDVIRNNKILKTKKLTKIILSKNKINNNNEQLKMDYFPFNVGQFDPRYNNNFINNLNYSVNYIKDVNRSINNPPLNRNQNNIKHNRTSNYQGTKKIKITKMGLKNLSPLNYKGSSYIPQKYRSPNNNQTNIFLRKNKFSNNNTNIQVITKYKSPF